MDSHDKILTTQGLRSSFSKGQQSLPKLHLVINYSSKETPKKIGEPKLWVFEALFEA